MSIELKQAAQAALEQLEFLNACYPHKTAADAVDALRTAIQQAEAQQPDNASCKSVQKRLEAQQPATTEPVVWGWAIVDNKGIARQTRARAQDFCGSIQEAKPFGLEDVAREDREFAVWAPHRVITLYDHPAQGVPEDVARDAIATVREQYRGTDLGKAAEGICDAIDAAMLAASPAQKGGE